MKLGIFMMIFSGVFFAATLIIPLLDLPVKTKVIAATTSLILMEVVFWGGGLLVGKELLTKYKHRLNLTFRLIPKSLFCFPSKLLWPKKSSNLRKP